jgi:hypothetical protein
MRTRSILIAVAVLAGGLFSSGALAVEGTMTADGPMRVGPHNEFAEIGMVSAGSALKIHSCRPGYTWCMVRVSGRSGWVPGEMVKIGGFSRAKSYFDPAEKVSLEFQVLDDELSGNNAFGAHSFLVYPYSLHHRARLSDKRMPRTFRSTIDTPGFRLHKEGFPEFIGD